MKKSAKFLAMLLVLTMLLGIIPMAVAADETPTATTPTVTLGRTSLGDATLKQGTAPSGAQLNQSLSNGTISKDINETGIYKRLPRVTTSYADYLPVEYVIADDAVTLSNPDVIGDLQFSLEPCTVTGWSGTYPCIQFGYTALKTGKTNVTLKFYYKFDSRSGKTGWYYDVVKFTVNVSSTEVQKPDKPTVNDVERFRNYVNSTSSSLGAVYMWCDNYDHHAWFDYITDVDGAYMLGEVIANDGSVLSKSAYPWTCTMTVNATKYLEVYNEEFGAECGTHYLKDGQAETETATWYWNENLSKWQFRGSEAPVYIDITHEAPAASTYTVTYTDGVEGEEAFADQVYTVKAGDATPAFAGTPARDGYVFLGWEPAVADTVTADATYTAKWEEALTEVKLTTKTNEGTLLFLGDTVSVTATANTAADISMAVASYKDGSNIPNLELESKTVSEDGKSATFTYKVVTVKNGFAHVGFTATATKGTQNPVVSEQLKRGLNFRNRIHVTIKDTQGNVIGNATEVKLNHKYPEWNKSPELKFDANKSEYVMKNAWDLSNQEFVSVSFTYAGETYETDKTADGENLFDVISAGTKEIYVEYVVVAPIKVTVNVNGGLYTEQSYKGSNGAELNYTELYYSVFDMIKESGKMATISITVDGTEGMKAVFGTNKNVVINVTTN